ncbi:MAG: N-acyl homoserine lactonase family protein [SAR324 cluster bacterium]|nr:N-acyl homoserine lactonase family protein [SAR324 cluster bacterium]
MKRLITLCVAFAIILGAYATSAIADSPAGMKLYVFSSGALTIGKGVLQNFAPMEPPIQIPVSFFVIKHPKGNVLFDTGNNDKIITNPCYWGPYFDALKPVNTPDVAIDVQLKKIGMTPDDIKYVVISHMHLDHAGNIAKFPNATIVMQLDEIYYGAWPDEPYTGPFIPADWAVLRSAVTTGKPNAFNMLILEGDADLFNDGSVIVKSWRGHTKGHSMMLLDLPKTGSLILTADNVYFRENVEKSIPPNLVLAYDPAGIMRAYEWIRYMAASRGTDYFTSHDPDAFKARKKAPEYYE